MARSIRGQGGPPATPRSHGAAQVAARLPAGQARDRGERLEAAAQQRRATALRVEELLRLGRRFTRGERDVHGQDRRTIAGRLQELEGHVVGRPDLRGERSVREVVDDGQNVIGARRGHRLETGAVGDRRLVGAPRVQRVGDVAHRGQGGQDRRARSVGDGRQVDPRLGRLIGDERRLPGRDRDHPGPAPADGPAGPPDPSTSSAVSSNASRSAQTMTPAASSAASVTRASPASDPECAIAATCACALRPTLTAMIGLPISRARSARARKRSGRLNPSTNRMTELVSGSSRQ